MGFVGPLRPVESHLMDGVDPGEAQEVVLRVPGPDHRHLVSIYRQLRLGVHDSILRQPDGSVKASAVEAGDVQVRAPGDVRDGSGGIEDLPGLLPNHIAVPCHGVEVSGAVIQDGGGGGPGIPSLVIDGVHQHGLVHCVPARVVGRPDHDLFAVRLHELGHGVGVGVGLEDKQVTVGVVCTHQGRAVRLSSQPLGGSGSIAPVLGGDGSVEVDEVVGGGVRRLQCCVIQSGLVDDPGAVGKLPFVEGEGEGFEVKICLPCQIDLPVIMVQRDTDSQRCLAPCPDLAQVCYADATADLKEGFQLQITRKHRHHPLAGNHSFYAECRFDLSAKANLITYRYQYDHSLSLIGPL